MGVFFVCAVFGLIVLTWLGVKLITIGFRRRPAPSLPTARLANPDRAEVVYTQTLQTAERIAFVLTRATLIVAGVITIVAPWTMVLLVSLAMKR